MTGIQILKAEVEKYLTETLIDSLTILDAVDKHSMKAEERMTYGVICDVLEDRFPHLDELMLAWCSEDGLEDDRTYAQVLISGIEQG